jgi:hypothetical protein
VPMGPPSSFSQLPCDSRSSLLASHVSAAHNGTGLTRWRFDGANTLVREQFAPGYIRRVMVQLDGGGLSCHAGIRFSPRSGKLYQMNRNSDGTGEALFLRSVAAENVACKVIGHAGV